MDQSDALKITREANGLELRFGDKALEVALAREKTERHFGIATASFTAAVVQELTRRGPRLRKLQQLTEVGPPQKGPPQR